MPRRWSLYAAIVVAVVLPHWAAAQDKKPYTDAHLAQAERLVYAMGIVESLTLPTKRLISQIRQSDPARADAMAAGMGPFMEKKYIGQGLREMVASKLDADTCRQLAEHWEGPIGRKFVNTQVQLLTTGKAPQIKFTPKEEAEMKRFEKTPAFQAFARAQPAIMQGVAAFAKDSKEKMAQKMEEESARRNAAAKN
jgi:hypothetical protein